MNERIKELLAQCTQESIDGPFANPYVDQKKFAQIIVQECIDKIEAYRIPVGNSASGELACEWTYAALKEIRDDIKEYFGIADA